MMIREPIVADQFYPSDPGRCRSDLVSMLENVSVDNANIHHTIAGLVPHAGWTYSGSVAADVFYAIGQSASPDVVILFGGVHRYKGTKAAMFCSGAWQTPLGRANVDCRLAERVLGYTNLIADDPYAHENEHSIEVQLPFVQHIFPDAKILPIMVPPGPRSHEVGEAIARTITVYDYNAFIVGTTDLTHYGPHYGFIPEGIGADANTWAMEVNDRRFIDLVCQLKCKELVGEAVQQKNACSSGAVAATVAAAVGRGASKSILLNHTSSSVVAASLGEKEIHDSVGYAGIVFAKYE